MSKAYRSKTLRKGCEYMELHASGEDYLEAILILEKKKGSARSVDVAEHLGVTKPSVSRAVALLKEGGFLHTCDNFLYLTDTGREIAVKIYERHCFFKHRLISAGVDEKTAEKEPCFLEHGLSDDSFEKIKRAAADDSQNEGATD